MESALFQAARFGDTEKVRELLQANPSIDINKKIAGWTVLHIASFTGVLEPLELLLNHPNIDVNLKSDSQRTPFYLACYWGKLEVVKMLARDRRVDLTLTDDEDCSPLWWATRKGHDEVIYWLIASGRPEIRDQLGRKSMHQGDPVATTPYEMAKQKNFHNIANVLESAEVDEARTSHTVRLALGIPQTRAADLFGLVVLLSDGHLRIKPPHAGQGTGGEDEEEVQARGHRTCRFLRMAERLPMELQMLLCHRAYHSPADLVRASAVHVAVSVIVEAYSPPRRHPATWAKTPKPPCSLSIFARLRGLLAGFLKNLGSQE